MKKWVELLKQVDWKKVVRNKKVWAAVVALFIAILEASGVPVGEEVLGIFQKVLNILSMLGFFA